MASPRDPSKIKMEDEKDVQESATVADMVASHAAPKVLMFTRMGMRKDEVLFCGVPFVQIQVPRGIPARNSEGYQPRIYIHTLEAVVMLWGSFEPCRGRVLFSVPKKSASATDTFHAATAGPAQYRSIVCEGSDPVLQSFLT